MTAAHKSCGYLRWVFLGLGWLCVALGVVGFFVPGLPSTVFFLIALWAFSRCSERFHRWLYNHPRFGAALRDWHRHRVIPIKAKALALAFMATSLTILIFVVAEGWILPAVVGVILAGVAGFIVSRPSRAPIDVRTS